MSAVISNSSSNTSFTSKIKKIINRRTTFNSDDQWFLFLKDHRYYIRKHSVRRYVTEAERLKYQYKIRTYLATLDNADLGIQAFLVANDFYSESDFDTNTTYIYVPNAGVIDDLRKIYATYSISRNKVIHE